MREFFQFGENAGSCQSTNPNFNSPRAGGPALELIRRPVRYHFTLVNNDGTLAGEIYQFAAGRQLQLQELAVDEGRLDEMFREITMQVRS